MLTWNWDLDRIVFVFFCNSAVAEFHEYFEIRMRCSKFTCILEKTQFSYSWIAHKIKLFIRNSFIVNTTPLSNYYCCGHWLIRDIFSGIRKIQWTYSTSYKDDDDDAGYDDDNDLRLCLWKGFLLTGATETLAC